MQSTTHEFSVHPTSGTYNLSSHNKPFADMQASQRTLDILTVRQTAELRSQHHPPLNPNPYITVAPFLLVLPLKSTG